MLIFKFNCDSIFSLESIMLAQRGAPREWEEGNASPFYLHMLEQHFDILCFLEGVASMKEETSPTFVFSEHLFVLP